MVTRRKQHSSQRPVQQGPAVTASWPDLHYRTVKGALLLSPSRRRNCASWNSGSHCRSCAARKIGQTA